MNRLALVISLLVVTVPAVAQQAPALLPAMTGAPGRWTRRMFAACTTGRADACDAAAFAYRTGRDGVGDCAVAARLYVRAWTLRGRRSAHDLLPLYEMSNGRTNACEIDRPTLTSACEIGGAYACAAMGIASLRTATQRADQRDALARIQRGCALGAVQACYDLGPETGFLRDRFAWFFSH